MDLVGLLVVLLILLLLRFFVLGFTVYSDVLRLLYCKIHDGVIVWKRVDEMGERVADLN